MKSEKRQPFPEKLPRPVKRASGRTAAPQTPLHIRSDSVTIDELTEARIRERIGRKLGKFAPSVERVTVRLRDVNGPRGGVDTSCHVKVVLSGMPSIIVEETGEDVWLAFTAASEAVERTVRRTLDRKGARKLPARGAARTAARTAKAAGTGEGSLIGRRVGRSRERLEQAAARPEKTRRDAHVDTAQPKRSASDRRAGAAGTAARNTKLRTKGMTATLEDSATGKPSRKSTRKSANRAKAASALKRREGRALRAPKARAARARAKSKGAGRKNA